MTRLARRAAAVVVFAILAGIAIGAIVFGLRSWTLEDMHVYLEAATRLREGDPLYSTTNPRAAFQYAPWYAAAWVPLSLLPEAVVSIGWSAILVAASLLSVRPLLRRPGLPSVALAFLMLPILLFSSARSGNVQPLLIAGLVIGLERRWGPLAIAAAASLKAFPLALALVYLGRGEWRRFGITLLLTAALVAPMLLFDLSRYTVDGPREGTLYDMSPILWAAPVIGMVLVTIALARRRSVHAWLAAATTVVVGLPRMLSYDITFLLAGMAAPGAGQAEDQGTAGPAAPG
jgi:hypothetical protein